MPRLTHTFGDYRRQARTLRLDVSRVDRFKCGRKNVRFRSRLTDDMNPPCAESRHWPRQPAHDLRHLFDGAFARAPVASVRARLGGSGPAEIAPISMRTGPTLVLPC